MGIAAVYLAVCCADVFYSLADIHGGILLDPWEKAGDGAFQMVDFRFGVFRTAGFLRNV